MFQEIKDPEMIREVKLKNPEFYFYGNAKLQESYNSNSDVKTFIDSFNVNQGDVGRFNKILDIGKRNGGV